MLSGKAPLRQPGAQGLVAVDPPAGVLHTLGRAAEDDPQVPGLALHGVIVHGEDLLVIVLPGDGVGDLIDVYQLVNEHQHPGVPRLLEKAGEELQILVPVVVGDDDADPKLLPGLGFGGVLPPEPFEDLALGLIVPGEGSAVVEGQQPGEVEAVDHLAERSDHGGDPFFRLRRQGRVGDAQAGSLGGLLLDAADPAVQDQGQGPALGAGLGGHVADELLVGGKPLAPCALEPPLRGEVRVHHHEVFGHHIVPDGLEQKALAAAVPAYDKAEGGPAAGNDVHVVEEGVDLRLPAHGDVGQVEKHLRGAGQKRRVQAIVDHVVHQPLVQVGEDGAVDPAVGVFEILQFPVPVHGVRRADLVDKLVDVEKGEGEGGLQELAPPQLGPPGEVAPQLLVLEGLVGGIVVLDPA